jgi:hypothetical protein
VDGCIKPTGWQIRTRRKNSRTSSPPASCAVLAAVTSSHSTHRAQERADTPVAGRRCQWRAEWLHTSAMEPPTRACSIRSRPSNRVPYPHREVCAVAAPFGRSPTTSGSAASANRPAAPGDLRLIATEQHRHHRHTRPRRLGHDARADQGHVDPHIGAFVLDGQSSTPRTRPT